MKIKNDLAKDKPNVDNDKNNSTEEIEIFEPVLGEIVSDDSFSFTLLSCHCSGGSSHGNMC